MLTVSKLRKYAKQLGIVNYSLLSKDELIHAISNVEGQSFIVQGACTRCGGHGKIHHYKHVDDGICFKCGGSGVEWFDNCNDEEKEERKPKERKRTAEELTKLEQLKQEAIKEIEQYIEKEISQRLKENYKNAIQKINNAQWEHEIVTEMKSIRNTATRKIATEKQVKFLLSLITKAKQKGSNRYDWEKLEADAKDKVLSTWDASYYIENILDDIND